MLVLGCGPSPVIETEYSAPIQFITDFTRLPPLLKFVGVGELALYEGFPSEFWEPQRREKELKSNDSIRVLDHSFYESAITVTDEDAESLKKLLSNPDSFRAYRQAKKCGGFHADYCVEWKSSEATTQFVISFECREVLVSAQDLNLKCDLSDQAADKLQSLLSTYQQKRPIPEEGP